MFYERHLNSYWLRFHLIIKEDIQSWVFFINPFDRRKAHWNSLIISLIFGTVKNDFAFLILKMQTWFFKKTLCLVNLKEEAARLTPVVTYRPRVHWSVKKLPKKNLYDSIKLKLTSTSSSSWKENRKAHGSKYLIIKCDKDLIRVISQEYLLTGLWLFYVSDSSNI